ncbi:arsenate reductase/protein-tyrosine-phosphatase family protein [Agreia sp. Leaf244]|uniref:arsenate reductase/protein-tyrosine-phosphatase family protein n=1 Tax=Agreia sp. Leaf244 TaxID=1736305 RepID=UPI0009EB1F3A
MLDQSHVESFQILTVCTGNICRSPIMEQLLRARLPRSTASITISSAGTNALPGQEMTPEAREISVSYGGDPGQHQAAQLTRQLIERSSLILTATREHRAAVVSLHPRASRYTFTLKEFARVSAVANEVRDQTHVGGATPGSVVTDLARYRGFAVPPIEPGDDDIVDPYRRSHSIYELVGREIDQTMDSVVSAFAAAWHEPSALRDLPAGGARRDTPAGGPIQRSTSNE